MTIQSRTTSLVRFLVRLAGILGGVWVCAGFGYRIGDRMVRVVGKMRTGEEQSYEAYAQSFTSSLRTSSHAGAATNRGGAGRWMDGSGVGGMVGGMRDKATTAWGGSGLGHRPTASVAEKIYSGEWWQELKSPSCSLLAWPAHQRKVGPPGDRHAPSDQCTSSHDDGERKA